MATREFDSFEEARDWLRRWSEAYKRAHKTEFPGDAYLHSNNDGSWSVEYGANLHSERNPDAFSCCGGTYPPGTWPDIDGCGFHGIHQDLLEKLQPYLVP